MTNALIWRTKPKRTRHKGEIWWLNVMSLHFVSLLLEAIFLKSKSLEVLGRDKDDRKLQETFLKALELLPKLWKKAGFLEEAITLYRKALVKPWNLDPQRLAWLQKDLATVLLYGGHESSVHSQLHHTWGSTTPENNLEEAILLLSILIRKAVCKEIVWDSEIMEHLAFALSTSNQYGLIAEHLEEILPGFYNRGERWYLLDLCYSATGQNEVTLDLLRNAFSPSKKKNKHYLLCRLFFAIKLCALNKSHAREGIILAQRALICAKYKDMHLIGVINRLLGICYNHCSRACIYDSQRLSLQKGSLKALDCAVAVDNCDPEEIFSLALVDAVQGNLKTALENAIKYSSLVVRSSVKGWKLLALIISAEQNYQEAESIVDLALDETAITDQLELLRLKAMLQNFQDQPKNSIESYKKLLAIVRSYKELKTDSLNSEATYSPRIFYLAVLLSNETALDRLSLVTEMTKHIRDRAFGGRSTTSKLGQFSPVFVWLLGDFYLYLAKDNCKITPRDYLELPLRPMQNGRKDLSAKNEIMCIFSSFV